jgi:Rieske Fe-S protein
VPKMSSHGFACLFTAVCTHLGCVVPWNAVRLCCNSLSFHSIMLALASEKPIEGLQMSLWVGCQRMGGEG